MIWRKDDGELRVHEDVVAACARLALDGCPGVVPSHRRAGQMVRAPGIAVRQQAEGVVVECHVDLDAALGVDEGVVAQSAADAVTAALKTWMGWAPARVAVHVRAPRTRHRHAAAPGLPAR
jgi:uncharacterized alkaline shock family protein YloU